MYSIKISIDNPILSVEFGKTTKYDDIKVSYPEIG